MWANLKSSIVAANDNPINALNSGLDSALGPSFDYLQTIQSPEQKGVHDYGTFEQVGTNANAITSYVGNLIIGPKVGNQFFTDTGGFCKAPGGKIVSRYTYVNNKLGFDDATGVLGQSFHDAVAGSGFDGLIPGAGGDIAAMNPLKVMNGLVLDGVPDCKAYTCPVTNKVSGVDQGTDTKFLTPSLEFNINPCKVAADQTSFEAKAPKNAETFANFSAPEGPLRPLPYSDYVDPFSYATLGIAVALFVGYVFTRGG
jgi:hypothetical protein